MSIEGLGGAQKWFEAQREGLVNPFNTDYLLDKQVIDQAYIHRKLQADPKNQEWIKKDEYLDEAVKLMTEWNKTQDAAAVSAKDAAKRDADAFVRGLIQGNHTTGTAQDAIEAELIGDSDNIVVGSKAWTQFQEKMQDFRVKVQEQKKKSGPGAKWQVDYYEGFFNEALKSDKFLEDQAKLHANASWGQTPQDKATIKSIQDKAKKDTLFIGDSNNTVLPGTEAERIVVDQKKKEVEAEAAAAAKAENSDPDNTFLWVGVGLAAAGVLALAVFL